MITITEIGDEARQSFDLIGESNERIKFKIAYRPTQQSWYFSVIFEGFELHGQKLVNSPNLLKQYSKTLPFGLECFAVDGSDPYFINDFVSGRATINLLTQSEVQSVDKEFYS